VIWWLSWWGLAVLHGIGNVFVRGRPPNVRVGHQGQSSGSTRQQLRQDGNARIFADRGGIFFRKRRWFVGSGAPPFEIPDDRWRHMAVAQIDEPQYLATWRDRAFWWYDDTFYWSTAGAYASADIKALLYSRQRQSKRELEHAHAVLAASTSPAKRKREPIPKDVRHAVWARDEGRCVECDSDFDIQYDHVIPFSMAARQPLRTCSFFARAATRRREAVSSTRLMPTAERVEARRVEFAAGLADHRERLPSSPATLCADGHHHKPIQVR
jgi:5-methylcytosine-specific restriction endonuclease McrA